MRPSPPGLARSWRRRSPVGTAARRIDAGVRRRAGRAARVRHPRGLEIVVAGDPDVTRRLADGLRRDVPMPVRIVARPAGPASVATRVRTSLQVGSGLVVRCLPTARSGRRVAGAGARPGDRPATRRLGRARRRPLAGRRRWLGRCPFGQCVERILDASRPEADLAREVSASSGSDWRRAGTPSRRSAAMTAAGPDPGSSRGHGDGPARLELAATARARSARPQGGASGAAWSYVLPDRELGTIVYVGRPTAATLVVLRQIGRDVIIVPLDQAIDPWPVAEASVGLVVAADAGSSPGPPPTRSARSWTGSSRRAARPSSGSSRSGPSGRPGLRAVCRRPTCSGSVPGTARSGPRSRTAIPC